MKKNEILSNSLIWTGAAISIAEIITGTFIAPLGFYKGLLAILLGHVIGGALLFLAGIIGAATNKCSMETTAYSFGKRGSIFFALLNVIQLFGWTGIMIYDGAQAAQGIFNIPFFVICLIIAALIILWIIVGIENIGKISIVAVTSLALLSLVLAKLIFSNQTEGAFSFEEISFGTALELSIAMPLSWLPLISDYTKNSEKKIAVPLFSALTYTVISIFMYTIGMGAAIFTGEANIVQILLKAGLGTIALVIVILSTVTTTFMDAWSAGISLKTIFEKVDVKIAAIITAVTGGIAAIFFPLDNITNFLYFIGSVFAPMTAILIADFFIVKKDSSEKRISITKSLIWVAGFILYRVLMKYDLIIGCTIPDMLFTMAITVIAGKLLRF